MSQPISPDPKRLYIETVGCQMNVLDSEMVVAALRKDGYVLTQDPAHLWIWWSVRVNCIGSRS